MIYSKLGAIYHLGFFRFIRWAINMSCCQRWFSYFSSMISSVFSQPQKWQNTEKGSRKFGNKLTFTITIGLVCFQYSGRWNANFKLAVSLRSKLDDYLRMQPRISAVDLCVFAQFVVYKSNIRRLGSPTVKISLIPVS